MEHLILLDTSELLRPMPRKLHAAWAEIHGRTAAMPPTVAAELAPQGIPADAVDGGSVAEQLLKQAEPKAGSRRRLRLEQQAWWARMWRQPGSPYEVVELNDAQEELSAELAEQIDPRCFRNAKPGYVPEHRDTRIICESIALNAKMLLTSNMRSIDHNRVNEWTVANGERLGFTAEPVLYPADGTLVAWATRPGGLDRWLRAGLIGCWPESDDAPAEDAHCLVKNVTGRTSLPHNSCYRRRHDVDDQCRSAAGVGGRSGRAVSDEHGGREAADPG